MSEKVNDVVSRIYQNFLMRDLTYVFGGGLLLASIKYAYDGNLIDAIDYLSQDPLKFIIFISASYFIGLIVQEGSSFIKIVETKPELPETYDHLFLLMADILRNYGFETIRRIERVIYLKHIGAAVGSASLFSSLILLVPLIKSLGILDFMIFFAGVLTTIVCLAENRWMSKYQNETLKRLAHHLKATT